jgi:cytochrome c peroxidase
MTNESASPSLGQSARATFDTGKPRRSRRGGPTWAALAVVLLGSAARAGRGDDGNDGGGDGGERDRHTSAQRLREFIDQQVGGIETLMVPAENEDLPQPLLANGEPDPFFRTTEEKRFLGKMLFHDPVRMVRIVTEFGGIPETAQSASCGSCHQGAAASKAGTLINFAAGGEGVGYTDARGNFIPRRRARTDLLPRIRSTPLFPGDALVDELPTLTDVYENLIGTPADGQLPGVGALLRTGRLDAVDSVGRMAPSVIGFAFNNRLLLDGFAGEADDTDGGLNPLGHPAQENLTLLLLDAHRMLSLLPPQPSGGQTQPLVLQSIPAYVRLFREAFPEEAASGDLDELINDVTVLRATATFLRTVVTRNTPWDRFLAGDDDALTSSQMRGARLFFTEANRGGAGCFTCHSGPMLNKQFDDPDVTGVGEFVEQNFHNLGLADHPLQALNRFARGNPGFRDEGRKEITGLEEDAFEFRTLTLRQLRDARNFMHNGLFTSLRDVVEYFNDGVPQDREAGSTATMRFTHPRGPGTPRGLGLSDDEVEDVYYFLKNALYDPAFVHFDPSSSTDLFQPSARDLTYSAHRPDLAALGAVDGRMPSGLPPDNNDPLSRRDMGLEFLDVTAQVSARLRDSDQHDGGRRQEDEVRFTNDGTTVVDTHLLIVVEGLPAGVELRRASGFTKSGDPYLRVFLRDGVLRPGERFSEDLEFRKPRQSPPVSYTLKLLSGQGDP